MNIEKLSLSVFRYTVYWVFFIFMVLGNTVAFSQSTAIIYSEDFNSGPNGWVTGGYNSSWSYGIPSLTNIQSNGTNCFVTGDAGVAAAEPFTACAPVSGPTTTGNFYNCCERSFVESPSINLSGVNSPLLSIDINVHCEQTFDGAKIQLSVNGGNNWVDVGVLTSSVYQTFPSSLNCREQNWYNKNSISYLSNTSGGCGAVNIAFGGSNSGWSGGCAQAASGACTVSDNHGTNGWVTATHCIAQAANKSNVKIRMVFGGGSQTYSDGIAFDNVVITDVYPSVAFSEAAISGCDAGLSFTNLTDCAKSYSWNFGYAGSTSTAVNPTHIFPSAGNYTVTLEALDFCGGKKTLTKQVLVNPGDGPVISDVSATSSGLCNSAVDSILIELSGTNPGTGPYAVTWMYGGNQFSESGVTGNPLIISGLPPGLYEQIEIEDAGGCIDGFDGDVIIPLITDGITVDAGNDAGIEIGNSFQLQATSVLADEYSWEPTGTLTDFLTASPTATPEITTVYTVTVTSANGCTATDEVQISVRDDNPCNRYFIPNSFTPNGDGKNEQFRLIADPSMRIADYSLQIFNRWGEIVFSTDNPLEGWGGAEAQDGIYAFVMQLSCTNKKNSYFSGSLSLIR